VRRSATVEKQTWIRKVGLSFSLVGVCLSTQVAGPVGGNRYWSPVHCQSTVLLTSVEGEDVPGLTLVANGRWMRGQGNRWWVGVVTRTSSMLRLRHDPRLVAVDEKSETSGA